MMIIVRIFPKGELEASWNRVLDNLDSISNGYCTPLFLSRREVENRMSLVYDVKEMSSFADILVKRIPSLLQPEKTRTVTLLKPVFFPPPMDRPASLERYQVAICVKSEELENVFNFILHLHYPNDAFPTYAAYSLGDVDILVSMAAASKDRLGQFVRKNLEAQKGVVSVEIGHITKSKRVAPTLMWKKYRESRYLSKPTAEREEYDFLEYEALQGAHKREREGSSFW